MAEPTPITTRSHPAGSFSSMLVLATVIPIVDALLEYMPTNDAWRLASTCSLWKNALRPRLARSVTVFQGGPLNLSTDESHLRPLLVTLKYWRKVRAVHDVPAIFPLDSEWEGARSFSIPPGVSGRPSIMWEWIRDLHFVEVPPIQITRTRAQPDPIAGARKLNAELAAIQTLVHDLRARGLVAVQCMSWKWPWDKSLVHEAEVAISSDGRLHVRAVVASFLLHCVDWKVALRLGAVGGVDLPLDLLDHLHSVVFSAVSRCSRQPLSDPLALLPSIKSLTVTGPVLLVNLVAPNVTHLQVVLSRAFDANAVPWTAIQRVSPAALAGFPNLTHLALGWISFSDNNDVDALSRLHHLTSLTLNGCKLPTQNSGRPFQLRPPLARLAFLEASADAMISLINRVQLPVLTWWRKNLEPRRDLELGPGIRRADFFLESDHPWSTLWIVDLAAAGEMTLDQCPPLRRLELSRNAIQASTTSNFDSRSDKIILFQGSWLHGVESLAVWAPTLSINGTISIAASTLKELTLHSVSPDLLSLPDHFTLPQPVFADFPVLETLILDGPAPLVVPLVFLDQLTSWPRLRRIVARRDQFHGRAWGAADRFPVQVVDSDTIVTLRDMRRAFPHDGGQLFHRGTAPDGTPDVRDVRDASHSPHPLPALTLTYHSGSVVVWPQLSRIIAALPRIRALRISLATIDVDVDGIACTVAWVARAAQCAPLMVELHTAMDANDPKVRAAVEHILAGLQELRDVDLAVPIRSIYEMK